jgi:hypothetical protein
MITDTIAGTLAGGHIRTLVAPFADDPIHPAGIAVLMSWCEANGMRPTRMLDRDRIEIHPLDLGELARDRHEIHWREVIHNPEDTQLGRGREARTELRKTPMIVEPVGLLAGELTCGHVLIAQSPVLGAPGLLFVCDQGIDPRNGRHPGQHAGDWAGEHRLPAGHWAGEPLRRPAPEDGTPRRMSWDNPHPGDLPFRDGLPYAGDLAPADAHQLVLGRLTEIADRRPRVDRRASLVALGPHVRGLREIAERHAPRRETTAAAGGPLCERRCSGWPCPDYRSGLAGIVTFAPAAGR